MIDLEIGPYENLLLCGDMDRLWEVLENLFENAFKYGDGRRIKLEFYEEDYCQLIRVFNTGEPVSDNDFNHIFESFSAGVIAGASRATAWGCTSAGKSCKRWTARSLPRKKRTGWLSFWFCGKYFLIFSNCFSFAN